MSPLDEVDCIDNWPDEARAVYVALSHASEARLQVERARNALVVVDGWAPHLDSVIEHARGLERGLSARLAYLLEGGGR